MIIVRRDSPGNVCVEAEFTVHGLVTEAWGQGFMVGALVVLIFFTVANMRSRVWLHKLILIELAMALLHGTFVFFNAPVQGWYTSSTAVLLYISYNLHNIINWIKVKPFLPKWGSLLYVCSIAIVCPYWIAEMYLNFVYNNNIGTDYFRHTRPWEAICREPWWIFTSFYLIYVIKRGYNYGVFELVRASPRFGALMVSIALSVAFIITDAVDVATTTTMCAGKNPYWKLALVFKCTADVLFLDDFKTVLDRLTARNMRNLGNADATGATGGDGGDLDHFSSPISRGNSNVCQEAFSFG